MDFNDPLPAGLLVRGHRDDVAAEFAAIALMQPVDTVSGGVACAPRAAPELARRGIAECRLPMAPLASPPGWPDPPSLTVGAWYLRSPDHLPPPTGFRELVQVPGEGFGAWPHPTTLMCLSAIEVLNDEPAIDVGCGSGLLSQAWAMLRGPVVALDVDPRAVAHATASLAHAHPRYPITIVQAPLTRVLASARAPTFLANVPPIAHAEILRVLPAGARTIVVSGVRSVDSAPTAAAYAAAGFTGSAPTSLDGWNCWILSRN